VDFADEYTIEIKQSQMHSYTGKIEGDYSNAAFLDAFNHIDSDVQVRNLNPHSLQGDRVYRRYFEELSEGIPTIDISDCPDLGPVLFALASMKNCAVFTGTERLKAKESDRGKAMHEELSKLGGGLIFGNNTITVPKQALQYRGIHLNGHNDHRIVMAMSVVLSKIGGAIDGAEAIRKSYPGFFEDIQNLGAKVEIK
jgi:3-phosphoshikimate 1-carboxyvinyltransferase